MARKKSYLEQSADEGLIDHATARGLALAMRENPARNPAPAEIRALRESLGLSQTAAAAVIHSTLRAWQGWEAAEGEPGHRRMHPGLWELFRIKAGE